MPQTDSPAVLARLRQARRARRDAGAALLPRVRELLDAMGEAVLDVDPDVAAGFIAAQLDPRLTWEGAPEALQPALEELDGRAIAALARVLIVAAQARLSEAAEAAEGAP